MAAVVPRKRWLRADMIPLLAALAILGCGLVPFTKIIADGQAPLAVTIRSSSGSKIQAVSAQAFDKADSARYALENQFPPTGRFQSASQDPFDGEPLTVYLWMSWDSYNAVFWLYKTGYYQSHYLVVLVRYADGRREGRMIDIPDLRTCRIVVVDFP